MTYVRILRKNELKKIYRLVTDIIKGCKSEDYKYLFIGPDGARGTDSYRNGKYSRITFEKPIAIPLPVIDAIKASKAETVELALIEEQGKEYIQFNLKDKKDEALFTIKLNKPCVQYPPFESIERLRSLNEDAFEAGTKDLKDALTEISKISKDCIFEIGVRGLRLRAMDDKGVDEKKIIDIPTTKSTRPFKIALNPKYVLDYLDKHESLTVKMHFCNASTYVWFEEYKDSYDYILMPLALRD